MRQVQIYLSLSSSRRQELLDQLGVYYYIIYPEIDEKRMLNETGLEYVTRLAIEKAVAGAMLVSQESKKPILGADTCVVIDGSFLGKPNDFVEYNAMMQKLSGNRHEVLTAVAVINADEWEKVKDSTNTISRSLHEDFKRKNVRLSITKVTFRDLLPSDYRDYWETGEPRGKAGGYAIQGKGAMFIKLIEGSYSGVVGLSLFETSELLRNHAVDVFSNYGGRS